MENITKQNGNIAFVEETHKYFDVTQPDKKFVSVTTMIHSFTQSFREVIEQRCLGNRKEVFVKY